MVDNWGDRNVEIREVVVDSKRERRMRGVRG
jgi:hypothetical protein